jgi:hypothetical protein
VYVYGNLRCCVSVSRFTNTMTKIVDSEMGSRMQWIFIGAFAGAWALAVQAAAQTIAAQRAPNLNGGNGKAEGYHGFTPGRLVQFGAEKKF